MTKFTKIIAAAAMAAAVLAVAGCSNNNTSSASDTNNSTASDTASVATAQADAATAEVAAPAATAEVAAPAATAEVAAPAATAEVAAPAATAEVAAPAATAEAAAPAYFGSWILAGIDAGSGVMSVADYADSIGASADDCLVVISIDENGYTTASSAAENTFAYTESENGIDVDMGDAGVLNVIYDADTNALYYGAAGADGTVYKFVFMNASETAATTEAAE